MERAARRRGGKRSEAGKEGAVRGVPEMVLVKVESARLRGGGGRSTQEVSFEWAETTAADGDGKHPPGSSAALDSREDHEKRPSRLAPLGPLAISSCSQASSVQPSPGGELNLTESGRFTVGELQFSKEGVVPAGKGATALDWSQLEMGPIIGRGASGYVRRATHILTRELLAVKKITISDAAKRKATFQEVTTLLTFASEPTLVRCDGVRYSEGDIDIAMEFMDCGSLADLMQRSGPLPEPVLADIIGSTLRALGYLRERHLVHRDLKPQNMLLSSSGHCKLSDFGCVAELSDSFAACGTFVGTVPYMSPERIQGDAYSYASDVWALGLVLVEAAIGRFPYAHFPGYWGILQAVMNEPSPTLPADRFSAELVDFANQFLHKNPQERPSARILLRHPFMQRAGEVAIPSPSLRALLERLARGRAEGRGDAPPPSLDLQTALSGDDDTPEPRRRTRGRSGAQPHSVEWADLPTAHTRRSAGGDAGSAAGGGGKAGGKGVGKEFEKGSEQRTSGSKAACARRHDLSADSKGGHARVHACSAYSSPACARPCLLRRASTDGGSSAASAPLSVESIDDECALRSSRHSASTEESLEKERIGARHADAPEEDIDWGAHSGEEHAGDGSGSDLGQGGGGDVPAAEAEILRSANAHLREELRASRSQLLAAQYAARQLQAKWEGAQEAVAQLRARLGDANATPSPGMRGRGRGRLSGAASGANAPSASGLRENSGSSASAARARPSSAKSASADKAERPSLAGLEDGALAAMPVQLNASMLEFMQPSDLHRLLFATEKNLTELREVCRRRGVALPTPVFSHEGAAEPSAAEMKLMGGRACWSKRPSSSAGFRPHVDATTPGRMAPGRQQPSSVVKR